VTKVARFRLNGHCLLRGHIVLDVAAGPGDPALSVASLVGPEGKVVGIDPIPEMVGAAPTMRFRPRAGDQCAVQRL